MDKNSLELKIGKERSFEWSKRVVLVMMLMQLLSLTTVAIGKDLSGEKKKLNSGARARITMQVQGDVLVSRRAPGINGTRIEGSVRVLTGESFSLNSNATVTGNIYVPGTPTINANGGGNSVYRGTIEGTGSTSPSGYSINLNSNTTLNHIVTRTDAIQITNVPNVVPGQGTRDVSLSKDQSAGDFGTIRNLTLNSNYGLLSVPAGSYGQLTANSNTGFILGVENQSTTYNLQGLNLNSNSELQIRGNVTINIQNAVNLSSNVKVGNQISPISLAINIANGGMSLNSNTEVYASVKAPTGQVNLNSNSKLVGLLICDRANLNSNSLLKGFATDLIAPQVTITSPTQDQVISTATTTVTGTFNDDSVVSVVKVNGVTATITGSSYTTTVPLTVGSNTITAVATDIFGNSGTTTVTVTRNANGNTVPVVNAGADQTITLPTNSVTLNGSVTDDGLPNPPAQLNVTWSKVSAPAGATVSFSTANQAVTTATFSGVGTYVLKLEASDSILSASDTITVVVNQEQQQNLAPVVNAGVDQSITLPTSSVTLNGSVTDDGLPNPPAQVSVNWSKVSGGGTVSFSSSNAAVTTASFSQAGTYVLRLTATDTALTSTDDVVVVVNPAQPDNQAPVVNAGTDQTVTLGALASLQGQVTDDGRPNPPGQLTIAWSKAQGPGTVTFTNTNGAITQASFSQAGNYTLRLTASDGALSSSDDVVVVVNAPVNLAPVVSAGADATIVLPQTVTLTGTATDDGIPLGVLTVLWSKVNGPGEVSFSNATNLTTVATFTVPGTYVLRLTATDTALSTSDDVTVEVSPQPIITILSNNFGFEPEIIEIAPGVQKVFIRNRTGLDGLVYQFSNSSGVITQVTVDSGQDQFIEISFVVGEVTLRVEPYDWSCQIVVVQ